ncbi:MAG: hypothetical protein LBL69_03995, partial [Zoogloeaceae bacterium]|nr:hypothetical protein [Zoogloeaceae bacterium]
KKGVPTYKNDGNRANVTRKTQKNEKKAAPEHDGTAFWDGWQKKRAARETALHAPRNNAMRCDAMRCDAIGVGRE